MPGCEPRLCGERPVREAWERHNLTEIFRMHDKVIAKHISGAWFESDDVLEVVK